MHRATIDAEVAFAKPDSQELIPIRLEQGTTVHQAILNSGIVERNPEIDLNQMNIGVFGIICQLEKIVEQGDRIEIYRPLLQNPMDARRNRVGRGKALNSSNIMSA